ncbi:hypothetical protein AAHE18_03G053000 [Arachis hypogaea]
MRLMGCCKPVILILETLQTLKTLLMGNIMCKHCMNRSVLLVRLFPGISLFSCLLGSCCHVPPFCFYSTISIAFQSSISLSLSLSLFCSNFRTCSSLSSS